MLKRTVSGIFLTLLLISTLMLAFNIQPAKTDPNTMIVPDDYGTIQEAVNSASEGNTVFVRNGTYFENVVVNKTVSLVGENKNDTIIDGSQAGIVVTVTADNVSINGFTIQNGEIGLYLNSSSNTITSNIFSFNGAQETDLRANLEIYPEPPSVPIWLFLYDLIDSDYTEFLDLTTDTPLLEVEVIGHSDVAELCLGLFYDENMDGVPQLNEYVGFASRDKVTWITIPNPAKGRYIIKVQGWNVLGNPGHFDREIIKYNGYGISTYQTFNNTISQNLIVDNNGGIYLQSCSNIVVHSNNMTRNWGGIIVGDIADSIIDSNQANGNNQTICLRNARNVNVTNNMLSNNTFGIHIWNSSRINVTENELYSHQGWSIGLILSFDSHVANNTISTVYVLDGIRLMFSSGNNLTGNNISYCEHSGILLWYDCYNNNAIDNYISHSGFQGWGHGHGVEILLSHNNVFSNNTISFNERNQGIVAIETSNNIFIGNLISSNCKGIQLRSSFGNHVYHNNIIDNWEQQSYDDTGENFWDSGYPSGGNYWSDYTGVDLYSGPYQNETGSDGMGDTPYVIDEDNQDNYPLMNPWPSGWKLDFTAPTNHPIVDFGVYNGSLYAAADNKLYVKDGSSWNVIDAPSFVTSLEPYGDKLLVGGQGGLYCYDGTSFSLIFSVPTYIKALGVYNNTFYAGTMLDNPPKLYYCNGPPENPANWYEDSGFSSVLNFSGAFGSIDSFWTSNDSMGAPVGYWKFDEGAGSVAFDSSGNNFDGAVNGANWTDGILNKALEFDGQDDYVEVLDSAALNPSLVTVIAWVKFRGFNEWWRCSRIVAKGTNDRANGYFSIDQNGTDPELFRFILRENGAWYSVTGITDIAENVWYHVAGTYDGSTLRIYVNGMLEGEQTVNVTRTSNTDNLQVGTQRMPWYEYWFNGTIDEVKIYDYARTPEEIWNDYSWGGSEMYAISGGTVYCYNGTDWRVVNTFSDVYAILDVQVYNGKLYLATRDQGWRKPYYQGGTGFSGRVIEFDGSSWTTVLDHDYWVYSLEVYDDKLYAGTANNILTYNGTDWETSFNATEGAYYAISMITHDGKIYAGMGNGYIFVDPALPRTNLEVTDAISNTTQSETARIAVAPPVPVGGYSFPIEGYTTKKPLTLYLALIGILTVSFTIVKRRKKQQN